MWYSPEKDSFYPDDLLDSYKKAGTFPKDCIKVDVKNFLEFSENPKNNKFRKYSEGVGFHWVEKQPIHNPETERLWRDSELRRADIELNKVQDSDPKAVGSVSEWRTYRKELRAWPEHKDFPNKEFRPKAPDNKE